MSTVGERLQSGQTAEAYVRDLQQKLESKEAELRQNESKVKELVEKWESECEVGIITRETLHILLQ